LRPGSNFKLIVGREEGENRYLEGYRKRFINIIPTSHTGPLVLIDGEPDADDIELAARLTARFSQGRDAGRVTVAVKQLDGMTQMLDVIPMPSDEIPEEWYV
jgi:tRNA-specific 2-thiouridylase